MRVFIPVALAVIILTSLILLYSFRDKPLGYRFVCIDNVEYITALPYINKSFLTPHFYTDGTLHTCREVVK